ncbi:MalM family protein [Vibrio hannami]|uniref:MalM family protein n=1 Tax=Vibrio hannami TaxID=2717094 RepID=UPI00240F208F|nr:MalM family protein [Vibrio hannami]MDG3085871.1 MalM family protein [Vibrio hannami]
MKNFTVVSLLSLSILGCANTAPSSSESQLQTSLSSDSLCCVSEADFPWVVLDKVDSFKFEINESAPVWGFESGKSYFSAFEFSQQSGSVRVTLKSNMVDKSVFAPSIALLDEQYLVVKTFTEDDFKVRFSDALSKSRYEKTFEVDSVKTPYMVIYTDSNSINDEVIVPHPAKVRAIEAGEPMPIVTDLKYTNTYSGELELEIETLSLSGYKQKKQQVRQKEAIPAPTKSVVKPLQSTQDYYHSSIQQAVEANDIPKALSLLEEAKALNVEDAQKVFVEAVNAR